MSDTPGWFTRAIDTTPESHRIDVDGTSIHYLAWGEREPSRHRARPRRCRPRPLVGPHRSELPAGLSRRGARFERARRQRPSRGLHAASLDRGSRSRHQRRRLHVTAGGRRPLDGRVRHHRHRRLADRPDRRSRDHRLTRAGRGPGGRRAAHRRVQEGEDLRRSGNPDRAVPHDPGAAALPALRQGSTSPGTPSPCSTTAAGVGNSIRRSSSPNGPNQPSSCPWSSVGLRCCGASTAS